MQAYNIEIGQYQQNTNIISNSNNITFVNTGAISVQINTFTLLAGASLSIGGNENEIDRTRNEKLLRLIKKTIIIKKYVFFN